jgi:hypothetical protein
VATADHAHHGLVVGHLGHRRRDEELHGVRGVRVGELGEVARDALLQTADERGKVHTPVRGLVERAQRDRGVADRRQPLSAHVADQQPGRAVVTRGGVQVAADAGLGRRGDVDRGDAQRPEPGRYRTEHHALCGLRHRAYLRELSPAPVAEQAVDHQETGDQHQGADLHLVVEGA